MNLFIIFYAVMTVLTAVYNFMNYVVFEEFRRMMDNRAKTPLARIAITIAASILWPLDTVLAIIDNIRYFRRKSL